MEVLTDTRHELGECVLWCERKIGRASCRERVLWYV